MKRPLQERLARIVRAHAVDIVLLAECDTPPDLILDALNRDAPNSFCFPNSSVEKIRLFTRFKASQIIDQFNGSGLTIKRLRIGIFPEVLLAAVHFPSKMGFDRDAQTLQATTLISDIAQAEEKFRNYRTILVGDLNMNPFDPGMIGAQALHSVMSRQQAERQTRTVQGVPYRYFYNPMWGHFGDRTPGPPGTYYYANANPANHFWQIFDQVLLRPQLMNSLRELQILESDGIESLISANGRPNRKNASDHLPLLFKLEL